ALKAESRTTSIGSTREKARPSRRRRPIRSSPHAAFTAGWSTPLSWMAPCGPCPPASTWPPCEPWPRRPAATTSTPTIDDFRPRRSSRFPAITGVAVRRFPELGLDDRESLAEREVEDQPGDVLGRRVDVDEKHRLSELLQHGHDRIATVQNH